MHNDHCFLPRTSMLRLRHSTSKPWSYRRRLWDWTTLICCRGLTAWPSCLGTRCWCYIRLMDLVFNLIRDYKLQEAGLAMASTPSFRWEIRAEVQDLTKRLLVVPDLRIGRSHPIVATSLNVWSVVEQESKIANHRVFCR